MASPKLHSARRCSDRSSRAPYRAAQAEAVSSAAADRRPPFDGAGLETVVEYRPHARRAVAAADATLVELGGAVPSRSAVAHVAKAVAVLIELVGVEVDEAVVAHVAAVVAVDVFLVVVVVLWAVVTLVTEAVVVSVARVAVDLVGSDVAASGAVQVTVSWPHDLAVVPGDRELRCRRVGVVIPSGSARCSGIDRSTAEIQRVMKTEAAERIEG